MPKIRILGAETKHHSNFSCILKGNSKRQRLNPKLEIPIIVILFFVGYYGILYHPTLPVFINEFNTVDGSIYMARFLDVCTSLLIFTLTAFLLIPRFLEKHRILPFILLSVVLIAAFSLLESQLDRVILRLYNLPLAPNEISDKMLRFYRRKSYDFPILPVNLIVCTSGILYGLSRDWIKKFRRESKLTQEKMQADIDFLRSQINPHFFFNALNNIYAITQRNKDDDAGQALMKLSGMMRYMTYESNVAAISLASEIEHMENFLEVARLKFAPDEKVDIQLKKEGNLGKFKIAPLLLIPLVENAFKHGLSSKGEGYIHMDIYTNKSELSFRIENPILDKKETLKKHSGVGLDNVKKRLDLIYPHKHQLEISESDEKFIVTLRITMKE